MPILHALRDLFFFYAPRKIVPEMCQFAFIVHSRNLRDVYEKYPLFRKLPNNLVNFLILHFWPVTVSHITGLRRVRDGKLIEGLVIGFPMTARQMLENRELVKKRVVQSAKLAQKLGAKIIGLGALSASLSKGGLDVVGHIEAGLTTGAAYTSHTVSIYVLEVSELMSMDRSSILIAIVGATGSIGSNTAKLLVEAGCKKFLLVDTERKAHMFDELTQQMEKLGSSEITISHQIKDIKIADIIVTATNAPEAVVHSYDLKPGAIIIDDAQPSDVAEDVFARDDVLVIEAGVVHTPGIETHFNLGLKGRNDNFCCLCETMILAANEQYGHFIAGKVGRDHTGEMARLGQEMGFTLAKYQNFKEVISGDKIEKVKAIIKER